MDAPGPHRLEYQAALNKVRLTLADLVGQAAQIAIEATAAATEGAPDGTQAVHDAARRVVERSEDLDADLVDLLARQSPVAGELRLVVAGLRIATAVERMAELADHVVSTVDRRAPEPAVPEPLRPTIDQLGRRCAEIANLLAAAIHSGAPDDARRVEQADDRIDALQSDLMAAVTSPDWPHGTEAAVDLSLIARYYERFADQAVSVARRLAAIHGTEPE